MRGHGVRRAARTGEIRKELTTLAGVDSDFIQFENLCDSSGELHGTAKGERGKGSPHPIARVTSESPLWDWAEVAEWLVDRGKLGAREVEAARVVRGHDLFLETSVGRAEGHRRRA